MSICSRLFLVVVFLTTPLFAGEEVPPEVDVAFRQILQATITNDYDQFLANTDGTIKATLKAKDLMEVSLKIRPRADQGYTLHYLGFYEAQGHTTYLWKLVFKDGGDDVLATMSRRDGKISGFYLR